MRAGAIRWSVAVVTALTTAGCFLFGDDDSSTSEPACDAPKVEPGVCGGISPTSVSDQEFFGIATLAQESGWNVYWASEYTASPPYRLQLARASASGQPVGVVTTLRAETVPFYLRGAVRLGTRSVFQLNRVLPSSQTSQPSELYVLEGDGTTQSVDLEAYLLHSAAPVFLDDSTVAAVGIGGDGASTWLDVKVIDLGSGSIKAAAKHATIGAAFPAVPEYSYLESISAVSVPGGIVAAWVSTERTTLRAALLDTSGKLITGPVDLAQKNEGGLFAPQLAVFEDGQIGAVWTGSVEVDVRFRKFPADLAGVTAEPGTVVNRTAGQQEHGRFSPLPGGGAFFAWGHQTSSTNELRGVALGPLLERCSKASEWKLSCEPASSLPRASAVSARGSDVLVAWYDWSSKLVQTRFLHVAL